MMKARRSLAGSEVVAPREKKECRKKKFLLLEELSAEEELIPVYSLKLQNSIIQKSAVRSKPR